MPLNYKTVILGESPVLQAAAADISLNTHILSITNCPAMDFRGVDNINGGWVPAIAETLGVVTTSNAGTNLTAYKVRLTQFVRSSNRIVIEDITYVSGAAGTTPASVSDALRGNIIALKTLNVSVNANGSATLIITANTGDAIITATDITNTTSVVTTAGVHARGTAAELVAIGVTGTVAGHLYSTIAFDYVVNSAAPVNGELKRQINRTTLYVNQGDANFTAFNTRMLEVVQAFAPGTTVADPKTVSLY